MIVCPTCSHSNMMGAAFCTECGTAFLSGDALTTQDIQSALAGGTAGSRRGPESWLTLHLLDTGQVLPLTEGAELTVGRRSTGEPIVPDIDLAPYQAYARGVSRMHAVIRRGASQVSLMDLDSANGTFVNGKRLQPKEEQPLGNGDVVALGSLKIQILFKSP